MGLSNLFKLQKLTIKAYKDAGRSNAIRNPSEFEAMFNPATYKQSYAITWASKAGLNASGEEVDYRRSRSPVLDIKLLLDGTGVNQMGIGIFTRKTVKERVDEFLKVAFTYNGDIHEPNYLLVEWGSLTFSCRLVKVDVEYKAFERDGTPLRAELNVSFIGDQELKRRLKAEQKNSPDLSHSRLVSEGDTLPLLTRDIYGSAEHFAAVARYNGLDDFRSLEVGRTLRFPPLAQLLAER